MQRQCSVLSSSPCSNFASVVIPRLATADAALSLRSVTLCAVCCCRHGWEKLGLYEFFRAKSKAYKLKEQERQSRARRGDSKSSTSSRSRSSSSDSSSSSSSAASSSSSSSQSASPSPKRRGGRPMIGGRYVLCHHCHCVCTTY